MLIAFDLQDDAGAGRARRGTLSVQVEPGGTSEEIAARAWQALGAQLDLARLDARDQAGLRDTVAAWVIAHRTGLDIGETRHLELELRLASPPPRPPPERPVEPRPTDRGAAPGRVERSPWAKRRL